MAISQQIAQSMKKASWIRAMFEQGRSLKARHGDDKVFDFTLGNPVMEPPPQFRRALMAAASDDRPGLHSYMPNAGYPDVRAQIAQALGAEHGVDLGPDNLIMTVGAAGALNMVLKALLDPGDEVIILAPYFVEYLFYIANHGGSVRVVQTDERFQPDLDALEAALSPATKAIILNSPNNPTGAVYSLELLRGVEALLTRHRQDTGRAVTVISDEPYRRLVYDGLRVPPVLSVFRDVVLCTSHAKDLSIPGERIGFAALGPRCDDLPQLQAACAFTNRTLGFVNAPALMQRTVASLQSVSIDVDSYARKRDLFCDGLEAAGYECLRPGGAFYLFPRSPIPDDVAFVKQLMAERILAVPGSGFGRPGHFRLAYCVHSHSIEHAMPGFRRAIEGAV